MESNKKTMIAILILAILGSASNILNIFVFNR